MNSIGILTVLLTVVSNLAMAKDYDSIRTAMIEAIDAPEGKVSGRVVGRAADFISNATKSPAPITLEISTLQSFKQAGCKRFQIALRQENVPTIDGKRAVYAPTLTMNMCRDGSPPVEGMNIDDLGRIAETPPG